MEAKQHLNESCGMINIRKGQPVAVMTLILSLLALYASLAGVLDKNLYANVYLAGTISKTLISGSIAQDIVSIPLALVLAILSIVFLKHPGYKTFIAILGLTGNFLYAYGLYVIEGQYTSIYLVYMTVFGMSLYSIIFGFTGFEPDAVKQTRLPAAVRMSIGIFLIMVVLFLGPGWLLKIAPDITDHIPGDTYAVYILDLCVVFPAFGVTTAMLLRNKSFGNILAGVVLMKAFTVCLSWAFAEWFALYRGIPVNYPMAAIASTLTLCSFLLGALYAFNLKKEL